MEYLVCMVAGVVNEREVSHPFNDLVLVVPVAERGGLDWMGRRDLQRQKAPVGALLVDVAELACFLAAPSVAAAFATPLRAECRDGHSLA